MIQLAAVLFLLAAERAQEPPASALTEPQPPPAAVEIAEPAVRAALEELRKAELLLAADEMAPYLAHSFTFIEDGPPVSGAFAYLEPMRRMVARKGEVRELRFDSVSVRAYGSSAVATYRLRKVWRDQGAQRRAEGWASDVFERRDDGAWILVHRHR